MLTEDAAYRVGKACVKFFRSKRYVIGRDMRETSLPLSLALMKGIKEMGADVMTIGICTTPLLYYAAEYLMIPGLMISASHSPKQYNGIKIVNGRGDRVFQSTGLPKIRELSEKDFKSAKKPGNGISRDMLGKYEQDIMKRFGEKIEGISVVVDPLYCAGTIYRGIFEALPIRFFPLHFTLKSTMPIVPNTVDKDSLKDLRETVTRCDADIGIAFDGDADRLGVVDEKGRIIPPDDIFALLAVHELKKHPRKMVGFDLRMSRAVKKAIIASGGRPKLMKVGNPYYKEFLRKRHGLLAGELSGHFMYAEFHRNDDGLYAAMKLLEILSDEKKKDPSITISKLVLPFETYYDSGEINIHLATRKDIKKAYDGLKKAFPRGEEHHLDGLSIEFEDWWFNVRPSNTEPLLRLIIEGLTKSFVSKKKKLILAVLKKAIST
ncbi:TPA: phosphomannomutase/phosphoglucomutase [Candidatus Woesearchaeota archaeon]|nr:phosphomannomutase/phosphoglucomutase [Candidatus Woesearchaeota archaeon]